MYLNYLNNFLQWKVHLTNQLLCEFCRDASFHLWIIIYDLPNRLFARCTVLLDTLNPISSNLARNSVVDVSSSCAKVSSIKLRCSNFSFSGLNLSDTIPKVGGSVTKQICRRNLKFGFKFPRISNFRSNFSEFQI